jgi:hypothetical protein
MESNVTGNAALAAAAGGQEQFWAMTGIIAIIFLGGVFGGWGATVLSKGTAEEGEPKLRFFILGVIASACVPLFLSLVQSGIIDEIMSNRAGNRAESYLIFAGLCLVAALTARNFLDSLSKRVLRDLDKVNDKADEALRKSETADNKATRAEQTTEVVAEALDEQAAEPVVRSKGIDPGDTGLESAFVGAPPAVNATERQVLQSLTHMTFRTATGVAKDVGVPRSQIGELLDSLAERGLAAPAKSPTTNGARWKITAAGLAALGAA